MLGFCVIVVLHVFVYRPFVQMSSRNHIFSFHQQNLCTFWLNKDDEPSVQNPLVAILIFCLMNKKIKNKPSHGEKQLFVRGTGRRQVRNNLEFYISFSSIQQY